MDEVFDKYLHALRQDRDDKTELSDRGALEILLNAAAPEADPPIRIIHEAKKVRGMGGPDFKMMKAGINHVAAVADTLAFTIDQMARIDEAYLAAFSERG